MPGFDGTGPRGYGPITGDGRGFCMLKMPDTANEPITGLAGLSGRPVAWLQDRSETELACLRTNVQRFQMILDGLKRHIGILETNQRRSAWMEWDR